MVAGALGLLLSVPTSAVDPRFQHCRETHLGLLYLFQGCGYDGAGDSGDSGRGDREVVERRGLLVVLAGCVMTEVLKVSLLLVCMHGLLQRGGKLASAEWAVQDTAASPGSRPWTPWRSLMR